MLSAYLVKLRECGREKPVQTPRLTGVYEPSLEAEHVSTTRPKKATKKATGLARSSFNNFKMIYLDVNSKNPFFVNESM